MMFKKSILLFIGYWIVSPVFADALFSPQTTNDKPTQPQAMSPDDFKNAVKTKSQQNLKNSAQQAIDVGKQQGAQLPTSTIGAPPAPPTPPSSQQPSATTDTSTTQATPAKTDNTANDISSAAPDKSTQTNSQRDNASDSNKTANKPNNGGFNLNY